MSQDYFAVLVAPCSQAEAEAGLDNIKPMTPLRASQSQAKFTLDGKPYRRVAASTEPEGVKRASHYVCDGTDDHVQIQAAIDEVEAGGVGGTVELGEGTFPTTARITIDRTDLMLRGAGNFKTWLKPVWNPASPLDYTVYAVGPGGVPLENLSISHLSITSDAPWTETDGMGGGGVIGVVFGEIYCQFVNNLSIEQVYGERIGFVCDIRNCNQVSLTNIAAYQASGPTALVRVNQLTTVGVISIDCKAVVDLGEVKKATISNVVGIGTNAVSGEHVKGIDVGGCTDVAISNFYLENFDNGINVKYEAAVRTQRIVITNGIIVDCENPVRHDRVGLLTGEMQGPALINNLIILGKTVSTAGINLIGYSTGDQIANCYIDVNGHGISATGTTDTKIHDNIVKSVTGSAIRAGKIGNVVESYGTEIYHNTVIGGVDSPAIFVAEAWRPSVHHNTINGAGSHGIWILQATEPNVCENTINACEGVGILLQWQNTAYTDAANRYLDFHCDRNDVEGWFSSGTGDTGQTQGIKIDVTGITGAAYEIGSVCGNTLIGSGVEIGIEFNGAITLDSMHIKDNTLKKMSAHTLYRRGTIVLGPNCQIRDNIGFITESSGVATIPSGATSIVVSHGLAANSTTPTPAAKDFRVTPTNNLGTATKFWISAVTATTFTITVDSDPGASTATFAWSAERL